MKPPLLVDISQPIAGERDGRRQVTRTKTIIRQGNGVGYTGVHLLVSDIYESQALHGVFLALFRGGIAALCHPVRLDRLTTPRVRITVLPVPYEGATQVPCRAIAELIDRR